METAVESTPETAAAEQVSASAAPESVPPPKNKGGRPKGSRSRKTLEREVEKLRRELKSRDAVNPFGAAPKDQAKAETETPPSGDKAEGTTQAEPIVLNPDEIPPLGIEGAKALAPAYYGIVNAGVRIVIRNAPMLKDKPDEAARLASQVQLDSRPNSTDRQAIDPPLILVLAKLRLTPEWALVIATGGVLMAKYAMATGDKDAIEMLGALNGAQPQAAA